MESDVSRGSMLEGNHRIMKAFIDEYRSSPELWDPKHDDYSNKYRRSEAQDRLLVILRRIQSNATRIDVRKKINTFRSNYNKKAGMVKAAEAEGREYVPKSWLYHELRFLETIRKPEHSVESIDNESESGDYLERITDNLTNTMKFDITYPTAGHYVEIGDSHKADVEREETEVLGPVNKRTKLNHFIVNDPVTLNKRKSKTKSGIRTSEQSNAHLNSSTASLTAIEPVALVWSARLQALQPTQRLLAEKAINDIMFEASMNNLQKGPLVINVGASSVSYAAAEGFPVEVEEQYIEYGSSD